MIRNLFIFLFVLATCSCGETESSDSTATTDQAQTDAVPQNVENLHGTWVLKQMTAPDRPGDAAFALLAEIEKGSQWTFYSDNRFEKIYMDQQQPDSGEWEAPEEMSYLFVLLSDAEKYRYNITELSRDQLRLQEMETNFHLLFKRK